MSQAALLKELAGAGVRLKVDGERLVVQAPKGALTPELADRLRAAKDELLALLRSGAGAARPERAPIPRLAPGTRPPLSLAQTRLWQLSRLAEDDTVYNVPGAFRVKGPLRVEGFHRALEAMVARHDILRARFVDDDGEPALVVDDRVDVSLDIHPLEALPGEDLETAMKRTLETWATEPIDLENGPPFHARILALGPDDHALFFMAHTILWDGWSFDMLLKEIKAHYEAWLEDADAGLPALPIQYPDFAAWQSRRVDHGELDAQMDYWKERLKGPMPLVALPRDREDGPALGYEGRREWWRLEGEVLDGLRALARARGATPYMVLLAGLKTLFHRYSGVEDVMVGSPLQCRTHPDMEDLAGLFVNTLFFRTRVAGGDSFAEVLDAVRDTCVGAMENQEAPSDLVVDQMRDEGVTRTPYEVIFVYQQTASRPVDMGPLNVRSIARGTHRVAAELVVWCREYEDYLDGGFDYRVALFEPERIRRMARHLKRLMAAAVKDPSTAVADLPLMEEEEGREIVEMWSGRGTAADAPSTTLAPGGRVRTDDGVADAEALAARASALRDRVLDGLGGAADGAGRPAVGLVLDATPGSVAALLALASLPVDVVLLDPALPADRIAETLAAAGARLFVASPAEDVPDGVEVLDPDDAAAPSAGAFPSLEAGEGAALLRVSAPGVRMVAVPVRTLLARGAAAVAALEAAPDEGVMAYAGVPVWGRASIALGTLAAGGTLVFPGHPMPDGWELEERLAAGEARHVVATPAELLELSESGWSSPAGTVLAAEGGLTARLLELLEDRADHVAAATGLPEAGGWALLARDPARPGALGRPLPGVEAYVLDGRGRPVPEGNPGALWLGGRDAVTPAGSTSGPGGGAPIVPTGDRVRWSAGGALEQLGRDDRRVRIDGDLADPAEIEATLTRHPAVAEAAVVAASTGDETRMAVHPVFVDGQELLASEVRSFLREHLPERLVPGAVAPALAALPRLPGGGVDTSALPDVLATTATATAHVEPSTPAEQIVAGVWREMLGVDRVGVDDNFFELGGHSLLAIRTTALIEKQTGVRLDPRSLFFQTLGQVAASTRGDAMARVSG